MPLLLDRKLGAIGKTDFAVRLAFQQCDSRHQHQLMPEPTDKTHHAPKLLCARFAHLGRMKTSLNHGRTLRCIRLIEKGHGDMNHEGMIGILAYGSLIDDPDVEIAGAAIGRKVDVLTPFNIEYARTSRSRGGAPTLVPVEHGGSPVSGQILILDLTEHEAANRLWRRETRKVGSGLKYLPPKAIGTDTVVVKRIENFAGVSVVLYTQISANIEPLTAEALAALAIASVGKAKPGMDGISYLIAAKGNGITTELSADYEAEILKQTGCDALEEALAKLGA